MPLCILLRSRAKETNAMAIMTRLLSAGFVQVVFSLLLLYPAGASSNGATRVEIAPAWEVNLVNEIPLSGSVVSLRLSVLSTEVEGIVSRVHVDAGDMVAQGDLLIELDSELSEIALAQARASAREAREALADSRRRLEEAQSLEKRMSISASEVRTLEAETRIDAAAFEAAEAVVRERQAQLERHQIRAPFAGAISRRMAGAGEWVAPGAQILELVARDRLYIDFQVPPRFFAMIDDGVPLSVAFDAYPGEMFSARVHRKVPLSSDSARTFLLRTRLENDEAVTLIPGMSADAVMRLGEGRQGIAVSRDMIRRYPDGRVSVWVIDQGPDDAGRATVREQQVRTGLTFAGKVEIRAGLDAGTLVVSRGNEGLREGQEVQVVQQGEG